MNTKKWLSLFMATAMTASLAVGFAGCDKSNNNDDDDDDNTTTTWTDPNNYYLVGDGKGTLALSHWDQTADIAELKFTKGENNAYTINAELYEGDEFGIIFNFAWAGQKGYTNMAIANEGKDASGKEVFIEGGGYDIKNMKVAEGASGKYELKMTTHKAPQMPDFSWTLKEKIELVTVTYYDVYGEEIKTESVKKGATLTPAELEDRLYLDFDGWYTAATNGEKFTSGAVNADLKLYARYTEEANTDYAKDTNAWYVIGSLMGYSWTHSEEDLMMTKDTAYAVHNVYAVELELYAGDQFKITYGGNWGNPDFGINAVVDAGEVFTGGDNVMLAEGHDGVYRITFVVNNNQGKIYWELVEELTAKDAADVYYLTGTYAAHPDWGDSSDSDWTILLSETEEGSGIWTCEVTITAADIPTWWNQNPAGVEAAAIKVKNAKNGVDYGVDATGASGTAGSTNVWLTVGTWTITFDSATGVITYAVKA